ncbi:MAG TPA: DUF2318 domain-containing protein [Nitrospirae bacterium]|nr:DUF2318 domain-containing protein [Nitrospirota bacterium]HDO23281.1 DUF2318 domain-containing protein [Nitrospirota bacterium]
MRYFFSCFIVAMVLFTAACSKPSQYLSPPVKGDDIVIDIKTLKDAEPAFFSYLIEDKRINFFVIKILDDIDAYLDACAKCYPHKMGYRVEGFSIVCRYCGVKYSVDHLKNGFGSCHPVLLKGKLKGEKYMISVDELKKGRKYF